ncbi:hypothetical protein [Methylobacterium trifolii]|nr:hypothetical protein [Methylobacterium trifolii]
MIAAFVAFAAVQALFVVKLADRFDAIAEGHRPSRETSAASGLAEAA